MMKPEGPFCQSCGMPLSRDAQGGGTEADGRKTTEYCSHCYRAGAFTQPQLTMQQMMDNVRGRLLQMNLPAPAVDGMVSGVAQLRRWKT